MTRQKGKLTKWDSEKGFGFVTNMDKHESVFIHKSAFVNRHRAPKINDIVTFSLSTDKQGRPCADSATFSGEKRPVSKTTKSRVLMFYPALFFLTILLVSHLLGFVDAFTIMLYFAMSALAFVGYAVDKRQARTGAWRTQESSLHALSLLGGWPGAAIAQQLLRHKSSKASFKTAFYLTVIVNIGALLWLTFWR